MKELILKVLVVAEHADGRLNPATARALRAAKLIGPATVVVFAADPDRRAHV